MGEVINTETIQHDMNGEINPYRELIVNNAERNRTTNDTNGTVVNFK